MHRESQPTGIIVVYVVKIEDRYIIKNLLLEFQSLFSVKHRKMGNIIGSSEFISDNHIKAERSVLWVHEYQWD